MPLLKGSSKEIISQNIKELVQSGRDQRQAIAMALRKSRESNPGKPHKDIDDKLRKMDSKGARANTEQIGTEN